MISSGKIPDKINAGIIDKVKGIKLVSALKEIKRNYLKRAATRKYILELPLTTESRKIPKVLGALLSKQTKLEIFHMWNQNYGYMTTVKK